MKCFYFEGDLGNDAMMDATTADSQQEDDHQNSSSSSGNGNSDDWASSQKESALQHGEEDGTGNRSDTSTSGSAAVANDKGDSTKVDDRLRKMAPLPNIPYQLQV